MSTVVLRLLEFGTMFLREPRLPKNNRKNNRTRSELTAQHASNKRRYFQARSTQYCVELRNAALNVTNNRVTRRTPNTSPCRQFQCSKKKGGKKDGGVARCGVCNIDDFYVCHPLYNSGQDLNLRPRSANVFCVIALRQPGIPRRARGPI